MIHQTDEKQTVASFHQFYHKIWVGFCSNTGRSLLGQVSGKNLGSSIVRTIRSGGH